MTTTATLPRYTREYVEQSDVWGVMYDLGVTPEQIQDAEHEMGLAYTWGNGDGITLVSATVVARCLEDALPHNDPRISAIYALLDGVHFVNLEG